MSRLLPWLFLAAVLATPLAAQSSSDCNCGDPPIILEGGLNYLKLPAGVPGAGTKADVEAVGHFFNAVVPGLKAGKYLVEVDAVETQYHQAGKRLINIRHDRRPVVSDFDVFKEAGGFGQPCAIRAEVKLTDHEPSGGLVLSFWDVKGEAMFTAIRVRNAAGALVAQITAADLRAAEPAAAWKVPVVKAPPIFRDPSKPMDERIDDLIRRMSLREKISQMTNAAPAIPRLGVPAYNYWSEALHGVARAGVATVFPQAIGLAATWNPALLHRIAGAIGIEARAKYNNAIRHGRHAQYYGLTFWSPNVNLFRDPRWGRGQETYGEDPFMIGRLAVAFITGLQGDNPHYVLALACAKHFAVHSGPEPLRHVFNVDPSRQDLYDTYLPQFEAAVREGHVGAVMSAYNCVYGKSASGSPFLLTDILRKRWGFQGHVVSDCDAVSDIWLTHHLAATPAAAAAIAVKAGVDLNCGGTFYALARAVKQGLLSVADIDRALHYVLRARFELGMFDPPAMVPFNTIPMSEVDSPAHAALALKAARESIVLLKNAGVLPLDRARVKRIAVIGANADSVPILLGNYNGTPAHPVTILQGIRAEAGPGMIVTYSRGCPLALHPGEKVDREAPDFRQALAEARRADVVIYVGGISSQLEGEEMRVDYQGFHGGDRTRIELPQPQTALVEALQATGKPVVFVDCSGSAVALPWEQDHVAAIVQAWYPGQSGGTAVADVLFGRCDPGGRLPITFYRSTQDLPPFTDYAMKDRTYRFFTGRPLYAFGYGLSYTTFEFGDAQLATDRVSRDGTIRLRVKVTNAGGRAGDEVVQVYEHRVGEENPALPREQLCAFQRVSVPAGASVEVPLAIPTARLRHWNVPSHAYVIDPGDYQLRVGASSADIRTTAVVHVGP